MEKSQDPLLKLYKKVSEKLEVPIPVVEYVVRHQFSFVRKTMQNNLLNNILLHNFGTFKVKKQRIEFLIRSIIRKMRKGNIPYIEGVEEIKKLWEIRKKKI